MTERSVTLGQILAEARRRFEEAGLATAVTDARQLILHLLDLRPVDLITNDRRPLTADELALVEDGIRRRLNREPVFRIVGRRDFYGLELGLSKDTLEPRPDTEVLVDVVLPHLARISSSKGEARIIDLGTGTGAIALALISQVANCRAVGVDLSVDALETADANAKNLGLSSRFETVRSHWFESVDGRFDLILSNPPYIRSGVVGMLDPEVRLFDPILALDGGEDGLSAYRMIASQAVKHLEPGGLIGLEIGFDQKQDVIKIFQSSGFKLLESRQDFGGNDRVLVFA